MKNECLFCAIVEGDMPSYKLYEDEWFCVILDRFPKCLGHTLILPKRHAEHLFALGEEEAKWLFPLAQRIATVLHKVLEFDGLNLVQNNGASAGQQVNHFHLHLIPRYDSDAMIMQYEPLDPSKEEFEAMVEKFNTILTAGNETK